jgi:hypothetical protein
MSFEAEASQHVGKPTRYLRLLGVIERLWICVDALALLVAANIAPPN